MLVLLRLELKLELELELELELLDPELELEPLPKLCPGLCLGRWPECWATAALEINAAEAASVNRVSFRMPSPLSLAQAERPGTH